MDTTTERVREAALALYGALEDAYEELDAAHYEGKLESERGAGNAYPADSVADMMREIGGHVGSMKGLLDDVIAALEAE